MKTIFPVVILISGLSLLSYLPPDKCSVNNDELFQGFVNPPAEARPFVRWWWNGNHINADEIKRQLDVLHAAGIGGIEINPIAMPEEAVDIGTEAVEWLSREWNELLVLAAMEARKRNMISDLIVGSGWPFGGEFLKKDETIQRVINHKITYSGGERIKENCESLYEKALSALSRQYEEARSYEVLFVKLVPVGISDQSEIIDLTVKFKEKNKLDYKVPGGNYELVYGVLQRSHREVMHGALGAAGPVMNHFDRDITLTYLDRLKKISEDTGVSLHEIIRALFCDSIELAGANWTDGFEEIFFQNYQYKLEPYYPFIFYDAYQGYPQENYDSDFMDEIRRVRFDYNKLLVRVFLDNFTRVFQEFCIENGLLCRYQAYGTPFLMGLMEGNMIPDIPESNNWLYTNDMLTDEWNWNQGHGYMVWNMYAASGGHLTGRKIISNESMTNTRGVFKTSLNEIKQHDDMNFITGMNHAVLHGYNYSPVEAGFPGWIRYGSYFSEQNTWWPYFNKWVDYNARLSYIFQQSQPVKKIAILGPGGDIWSDHGLTRMPFHLEPWYCNRLWEPLSQAGSSCDYISEAIIQEGDMADGALRFGPMSYKAIFLASVQSIEPETALSLLEFVRSGGSLVLIDEIPSRSLSLVNSNDNDIIVINAFKEIQQNHPDNMMIVSSPDSEAELLPWTVKVLNQLSIERDVEIKVPDKNVYQIRKKQDERDIFFFTNSNLRKSVVMNLKFQIDGKTPWVWNPEDGTRKVFPYGIRKNELNIKLQALESLLLVYEPDLKGEHPENNYGVRLGDQIGTIEGPWQAQFDHISGDSFEWYFEDLYDFGTADDKQLNTFAGTVTYSTTFKSDGKGDWLELEEVNKGITEVYLNGSKLGINWYGRPLFPINNLLVSGENLLEIKYTGVLSNYSRSLRNNPTAERWTSGYSKIPAGLQGNINIYDNY